MYLKDGVTFFLERHHITPSSATNRTPADLLFGRPLDSIFDRLHPQYTLQRQVLDKQQIYATEGPDRAFDVGSRAYYRVFPAPAPGQPKYAVGTVRRKQETYTFQVQDQQGNLIFRHADHLKHCHSESVSWRRDSVVTLNESSSGVQVTDGELVRS